MSREMICAHAAPALYHCEEVFTVPQELKLHDEWQSNQINFPTRWDIAALEILVEEEMFRSQAKKNW